jgi:hypothetical protein
VVKKLVKLLDRYLLEPVRTRRRRARLRKIVEQAHREYGDVFKRLGDS